MVVRVRTSLTLELNPEQNSKSRVHEKNIAKIAVPESVIHFGVFAEGHIERVFTGCALDNVDFQRSLAVPGIFV